LAKIYSGFLTSNLRYVIQTICRKFRLFSTYQHNIPI